jgi:hypothetical protein
MKYFFLFLICVAGASALTFVPVVEHVEGTTYRVGGYVEELPHNPDGSGQSGFWVHQLSFAPQYSSLHDSILTITFPSPGEYTFYVEAGTSDDRYLTDKPSCSNPRALCAGARETITVVVPEQDTRSYSRPVHEECSGLRCFFAGLRYVPHPVRSL